MVLDIKQLNFQDEKKWDYYVSLNKNATFYHQCGWKKVVEETYKHKSYYLLCENDVGDVKGILPLFLVRDLFQRKRLVSVPFAPYGGVCSETEEVKTALINEAINLAEELDTGVLEFRLNNNTTHNNFSCIEDYSSFKLDLSFGTEYVWKNVEKTIRTAIRKGEKNNLKFEIEQDIAAIAELYEIYSKNMKALGTPVHDYCFFTNIYKMFPHDVFIAKAKLDNKTISSLFLLKFKDTLIYGWGSSLTKFLKFAPNNFIHWNSIKYGCEKGLSWYDFGRSPKNSGNFKFKKRWNGVEIPIISCFYPENRNITAPQKRYRKFAPLWSKFPLRVTRIIGPRIRKYVV